MMLSMHEAADSADKLGASRSLIEDRWEWPIHGLRHPPDADTSGWYIWTGDLSQAGDFFHPIHTTHLVERVPLISKFLSLPPGTRFLFGPGHEDVWTDETLLDV